MATRKEPKFAYYMFPQADMTIIFVDYAIKRELTQSDIANPIAIAAFKKKGKKVLVDRFGLFDDPQLAGDLGACIAEARHRYKNCSPVECVVPSTRLSTVLNQHMSEDDKWLYEPEFETLFRNAAKQIKAEL
jgi:hypothetical protein